MMEQKQRRKKRNGKWAKKQTGNRRGDPVKEQVLDDGKNDGREREKGEIVMDYRDFAISRAALIRGASVRRGSHRSKKGCCIQT